MSGYLVTVTTTKRLDRGLKTIELKTFEYDKANRSQPRTRRRTQPA